MVLAAYLWIGEGVTVRRSCWDNGGRIVVVKGAVGSVGWGQEGK